MDAGYLTEAEWAARADRRNCPLCASVSQSRTTSEGYPIADLKASRLLLGHNQFVVGYCVLVTFDHVLELHDLRRERAIQFLDDMVISSAALAASFWPRKMNLELLGNSYPHLHCHLKPRYPDDGFPQQRIHQHHQSKPLSSSAEYADMADRIFASLVAAAQQRAPAEPPPRRLAEAAPASPETDGGSG